MRLSALPIAVACAACRDHEKKPDEAVAPPLPKPDPITIPQRPAPLGPYAPYLGARLDEVSLAHRELFQRVEGGSFLVGADGTPPHVLGSMPRFSAIAPVNDDVAPTLIVGELASLDEGNAKAVDAAWGAAEIVQESISKGREHDVWLDRARGIRIERARGTGNFSLTVDRFVPLNDYLQPGYFAFDPGSSLVGTTAADAVAKVRAWLDQRGVQLVTAGEVTARRFAILLPPTEHDFRPWPQRHVTLRFEVDEAGKVTSYDVIFDAGDEAAVDAIRALAASRFGSEHPSDDKTAAGYVQFGTQVVCLDPDHEKNHHARFSVGRCR